MKQLDSDLMDYETMEKVGASPQLKKKRLEKVIIRRINGLLADGIFDNKPGIVRELQVLKSILQEMARDLEEEVND